MAKAPPKPKAVNVKLIRRADNPDLYETMIEALTKWHGHLQLPNVLLFWRSGWPVSPEGKTKLATISTSNDLQKALMEHDLIISLNDEIFPGLPRDKQLAVFDHEFCHADVTKIESDEEDGGAEGEEGEGGGFKMDEMDRIVYRLKKHDLEEFGAVVRRHGMYMDDVQEFVANAQASRTAAEAPAETPADATKEDSPAAV